MFLIWLICIISLPFLQKNVEIFSIPSFSSLEKYIIVTQEIKASFNNVIEFTCCWISAELKEVENK
ncbi:MAG: hypothetical protein GXO71_08090 [Caldiserica bacterium]|nr:hypothetical protein [Caldisericota bacterium]